MQRAVELIADALPSAWGVELNGNHLLVTSPEGSRREILLNAAPSPTPASLDGPEHSPSNADNPTLVVAPYLSPASRGILDRRRENYLDLTGNLSLSLDSPAVVLKMQGAQRDPTPRRRPNRGIGGAAAGKIIRTLADIAPPYTVTELAELSQVSAGYCSRTLQALEREALVYRSRQGTVERVDWPTMLRRRGGAVALFDDQRTFSYVARTSASDVLDSLRDIDDSSYAVTGSFAAVRLRAITAPVGLAIYTQQPETLAANLGLLPSDAGADVRLIVPRTDGEFSRSSLDDGIRWVAPSQVVLDSLGGSGRMPQEGEAVLEWMIENEAQWRISRESIS